MNPKLANSPSQRFLSIDNGKRAESHLYLIRKDKLERKELFEESEYHRGNDPATYEEISRAQLSSLIRPYGFVSC